MCQCVCVSLFNFGELAPANERPKGEQAAVGGRMRVYRIKIVQKAKGKIESPSEVLSIYRQDRDDDRNLLRLRLL